MNDSVFQSFPTLATDRLTLCRHDLSDTADMFVLRSDPEVMKYLDTYPAKSKEEIKEKILEIRKDFDEKIGINWIVKLHNKEEAIGYMSLWRIDKNNNRGEIGYALKKEYWRKGIAKEAAEAIINFSFETVGLNTLMANTNTKNIASQNLLKKLGFMQEAHFREDFYFDGKYLDSAIFGLTKRDWLSKKSGQ